MTLRFPVTGSKLDNRSGKMIPGVFKFVSLTLAGAMIAIDGTAWKRRRGGTCGRIRSGNVIEAGIMRSDAIKKGASRAPARAMWKALGLTDEDLNRPLIGVANTWSDITPCNVHLRELGTSVKEGVRAAGGTPFEFNTITVTDGISMGSEGMRASLVSREVIADSIELVVLGHLLDGVVAISGCDKTIPGTVMALARLNLPSLMLYGGSIMPGRYQGKDVTIQDVFEAVGACAAGIMSEEELHSLEGVACPRCRRLRRTVHGQHDVHCHDGSRHLADGGQRHPSHGSEERPAAKRCGELVMDLVKAGRTARQIITRTALENAIASVAVTAGSTNAVLHLLAVAREAGVDLSIDDFDRICAETPVLADLKPAGRFTAPDVDRAGGLRLLMKRLFDGGYLADEMTVTGRSLSEEARDGGGDRRTGGHSVSRSSPEASGRPRDSSRIPVSRGLCREAPRVTSGSTTADPRECSTARKMPSMQCRRARSSPATSSSSAMKGQGRPACVRCWASRPR